MPHLTRLPELKDSEEKFVLIQGDKICGTFASYEDAMKNVHNQFGVDAAFLVVSFFHN